MAFHWDEGFHLLAARFISTGKRPYLDFLFAQAPLNAYWVAFWFRLLHPSWRLAHVVAAVETWMAVVLMAHYTWKRFPAEEFRTAAALVVIALFGLFGWTFDFGTIAQAYGFCILATVAAFRAAVDAREHAGLWRAALVGALAGAAVNGSLLTAAMLPALLAWLWFYNQKGNRWGKAAALCAGALLPAIPVLRLLLMGPRKVWFDLVNYHALYRRVAWPGATGHDVDVLSYWIQDSQQLVLLGLAIVGWLAMRKGEWAAQRRAEFQLCAWLVLAVAVEAVFAHPTFSQYFIFAVPFLAVLASAGFYVTLTRLNMVGRPERAALALGLFMLVTVGRSMFYGRDQESWQHLTAIAKKVDEVTPRNVPAMLQEPVYFLTGREVPFGMEFDFAHKLDLGKERNALFRIVPQAEIDRQIKSGQFQTAALCDEDERVDKIKQTGVYTQKYESDECTVFWKPNLKSAIQYQIQYQIQYPPPGSITMEKLARKGESADKQSM